MDLLTVDMYFRISVVKRSDVRIFRVNVVYLNGGKMILQGSANA